MVLTVKVKSETPSYPHAFYVACDEFKFDAVNGVVRCYQDGKLVGGFRGVMAAYR